MSKFSNRFDERLKTTEAKAEHAKNTLGETTLLTTDWEVHQQTFTGTIQPMHRTWQSRIHQILSRPVSLIELDRQLEVMATYRYIMWHNPIIISFRIGNGWRRVQITVLRVRNTVLTILWFIIDNIVLIIGMILALALLWWVMSNWNEIMQAISSVFNSSTGTTP